LNFVVQTKYRLLRLINRKWMSSTLYNVVMGRVHAKDIVCVCYIHALDWKLTLHNKTQYNIHTDRHTHTHTHRHTHTHTHTNTHK